MVTLCNILHFVPSKWRISRFWTNCACLAAGFPEAATEPCPDGHCCPQGPEVPLRVNSWISSPHKGHLRGAPSVPAPVEPNMQELLWIGWNWAKCFYVMIRISSAGRDLQDHAEPPSPALNHVPKCHIHPKHLQRLPRHLVPVLALSIQSCQQTSPLIHILLFSPVVTTLLSSSHISLLAIQSESSFLLALISTIPVVPSPTSSCGSHKNFWMVLCYIQGSDGGHPAALVLRLLFYLILV